MPSPVGHVLGGLATVFTTDIVQRQRTGERLLLVCGALAAIPDVDLVVRQYHRTATHSVTFVALTFIVAAAVTGKVTRWRTAALCALAYTSHLLLDWLGADTHPPLGIEAFWPFSDRWFISGADLFRETSRLQLFTWATTMQNAQTVLQEIAILLPIVTVLWLVREKAASRFAPEVARSNHPAK
jgi:membrane-bound metal-dependent hydrolase YbcI (DUF457 family)